uniref:Cystatin domain-containing protein n=1 Tax=Sciurus vulgaris TaxID=55149 RepID=A0A8D2CX21_SCIVU
MLFPPGRMALPWALLLLLLDCQLLVTPVSYRQEKWEQNDQNEMFQYFPPTLEFAVYKFNLLSKDKNAYRVLNVLSAKQEKVDSPVVFSMRVTLGRTKCRKFEENIDNCPFHEVPGLVNTIVCYFVVSTHPWKTDFGLLKSSCSG